LPKLIQEKHDFNEPASKKQMKMFLKDMRGRGFDEDTQWAVANHLLKEDGYYSRLLERRSQRNSTEDSAVSEAVEESIEGKKKKKPK
jgi:hypothetical protein